MDIYKRMYLTLFNSVSDAIKHFQRKRMKKPAKFLFTHSRNAKKYLLKQMYKL